MPDQLTAAVRQTPEAALARFDPARFGFQPDDRGWVRSIAGLGDVVIAPLAWPHAHAFDGHPAPLTLLIELQQRVWGMRAEDCVPANVLAVVEDTGGAVLVAYRREAGFTIDGWLGFVIGLGSRSGALVSHMLGVRQEARGAFDIGWYLKVLQGYCALRTGHTAAIWTFDPMRGANARLNHEKLGATAETFTLDKYGTLHTELYGDQVPSDRLTAVCDLLDPRTADRLDQIEQRTYTALTPADIAHLPAITSATLDQVKGTRPPRLRYRIPGDIDLIRRRDPARALAWRRDLRVVMSECLTTQRVIRRSTHAGPMTVSGETRPGDYLIDGFATGVDATGERESWYRLTERGSRHA